MIRKIWIITVIFIFLGLISPVFFVLAKIETEAQNNFEPGEVLIKLKDSADVYRFKFSSRADLEEIINKYKSRPEVEYVEPNYRYKMTAFPNDPEYQKQSYLLAVAAKDAWSRELVEKEMRGAGSAIIAILDSGVYIEHPDLKDNIWVNPGERPGDGIDNDNNGYIDDYNGWDFILDSSDPNPKFDSGFIKEGIHHGTIIAGIAAARGHNLEGITGVSWGAKIMPLRVLDSQGNGTVYDVYRAINYAIDNKADIINMSFVGDDESVTFQKVLKKAADAGLVLVAAAGNTNPNAMGINLEQKKAYPVCYDDNENDNFIIGVASFDSSKKKSNFSNFGNNCIDISAPGENFYSTIVYNKDQLGFYKYYDGYWSGTSVSAPLISGTAAIIKSLRPALSAREIIEIIINNTDDISQFNQAYLNGMGKGGLNIYKAVVGAIEYEKKQQTIIKSENINLVLGLGFGSFPQVKIFKQDFSEYKSFFAYSPAFNGSINVAAGDINNDGMPEIVTGAGYGGGPHVRIFNQEGIVLNQFFAFDKNLRNGVQLTLGDVNNDGNLEIIVGAGRGSKPLVRVFTSSGQLVSEFLAYGEGFLGGVNIAAGDINNDGVAEIITGAGPGGGPHVRIFDYSGKVIRQFFPFNKNSNGGVKVAVGNVVGGGEAEIVAAIQENSMPIVRVFRSDNFDKISEFFAFEPGYMHGVNLDVSDLDGDGISEIIVGVGIGGRAEAKIFNWQGIATNKFTGYSENYFGGLRVTGVK